MSLPYRLGTSSMFVRPNEDTVEPKRVVFLSVEGTRTEVCYFNFVEKYRKQLGIDAVVHVEVLLRDDTNSDPDNVLDLLEQYVRFRNSNMFETEVESLQLKNYPSEFIKSYLDGSPDISIRQRNQFEAVLKEEHINLLYLEFLNKYRGKDDAFGVVIDRDCGSHTLEQMNRIMEECRNKNYLCYISNPCIEFWLLLHVSDVATEYKDQLNNILKNELDKNKNSFVSNLLHGKTGQRKTIQDTAFKKYYLPNVDLAIERAKGFASGDELLNKIGSNLGELFDLLRT